MYGVFACVYVEYMVLVHVMCVRGERADVFRMGSMQTRDGRCAALCMVCVCVCVCV